MKKLALVLGSLLVVGTAASAKEVVPAPVVVPEKVVEIVEKPVIVYRDREVAPAWRPNGSVKVEARYFGEVEGHKEGEKDWKGASENAQLRTTTNINFTENQSLKVYTKNAFGLKNENNKGDINKTVYLQHTYNFGNLGSSKVNAKLKTAFGTYNNGLKGIEVKPVFDFSEYFFKNDYVKATALEIAPFYQYGWGGHDKDVSDAYTHGYGLYANAAFELPYGVTFQAEFGADGDYEEATGLFTYRKANRQNNSNEDLTEKFGNVELTLEKEFELYKQGSHKLGLELTGVYSTGWSYDKGDDEASMAYGTVRENGKQERWGGYVAKFDPHFNYTFQATEFVKLYTRVGAEYKNRTGEIESSQRHNAKHWRWQPYARVGFVASF